MRRAVRTLHRWLSPVFVLGLLASLLLTAAGVAEDSPLFVGLGVVVVGSILTLLVTGSVLFVQHYWSRRRRPLRSPEGVAT
jgi:hypothetical protein